MKKKREIPTAWYNLMADLPQKPKPPLHPLTKKPLKKEDLYPIFARSLIEQEVSLKRFIDIPAPVLDLYRLYRPTPLRRATRLEEYLKTPARIYYKDESVSPSGSHKLNTALAQAYYNHKEKIKVITTETGAGQWGSALSYACYNFKLKCRVYMVKVSYEQKPYRKVLMNIWRAEVFPSPSSRTRAGREILKKFPHSAGSLGIAISEAVEEAKKRKDTNYALGSVLNHVLLHQTIIGLEAKEQLKRLGERPDFIIGCVGGGSNYAGLAFPFVKDYLKGEKIEFIAVEPRACPTLTRGKYLYDFGDAARMTPLILMYTLGHNFIPSPIHAGGLRYHGMAPLLSFLKEQRIIKAKAYYQNEVFQAAVLFAQLEGKIPAPETAHAIKAAIDKAKAARRQKKEAVILFNYSGHGHFDLSSYQAYFAHKLKDFHYPEEKIKAALKQIYKLAG